MVRFCGGIINIQQRSNPNVAQLTEMFSDTVSGSKLYKSVGVKYSEVSKYVKDAMQGVAPEFTMKSKIAAKKVEAYLNKSHGKDVHFARQGSVMTNTHILKDNDVDLVQITSKSSKFDTIGLDKALENITTLKPEEINNLKKHKANFKPYEGDQLVDLFTIREKSEKILQSTYKVVDIHKEILFMSKFLTQKEILML